MSRRSAALPIRWVSLVCLLLLLATAGGASAAPLPELTAVQRLGSEVRFEPLVDAAGWSLVVSGPGSIRLEKEVANGPPSISLADIEAAAGEVVDGVYVYELVHQAEPRRSEAAKASPEPAGEPASRPSTGRRRVQFGSFSVRDGSIVVSDRLEAQAGGGPEPAAPEPMQVIAENLAVQGDLCAGSADCTAADMSTNHVIRVKGNNTRLEFVDTSSAAGFPTNDWELTANGTTDGSPDFFAITDADSTLHIVYVEAGAPANSLYVESDGDVGLGTASPATPLHVAGAATFDGDLAVLSSRAAKTDLLPVSAPEILDGLERLPLVSWRYLDDPRAARHLGPTAEDFHAIFGIGADSRHLSPADAAGVALASAQELQRLVREQQRALDELRDQRDELARRIDELEARPAAGDGED